MEGTPKPRGEGGATSLKILKNRKNTEITWCYDDAERDEDEMNFDVCEVGEEDLDVGWWRGGGGRRRWRQWMVVQKNADEWSWKSN